MNNNKLNIDMTRFISEEEFFTEIKVYGKFSDTHGITEFQFRISRRLFLQQGGGNKILIQARPCSTYVHTIWDLRLASDHCGRIHL
jgi:hypothetical protein